MRKNKFVALFAAVALVLLGLPVAAQDKAPAGQLIPAGSHLVVSFNIGSLLKKSGHENITDLPGMEELLEELEQENELAAQLLENPALLGVDFDKPIHVFGTLTPPEEEFGEPTFNGGLIAAPLSAKKFEEGLTKVFKGSLGEIGEEMLKGLKKEKGYSILAAGEGIPAALAFNDQAIVIMGGNDEKAAKGIDKVLRRVMGGKKPLAKGEATFATYLKNSADFGGWMDLNALMEMSPEVPEDQLKQLQELIGKIRMAASVNFVPGGIRGDISYSSDADFIKKLKPAPKKTMLGLLPHNAVASMVYAFDMAGARKWMKEEYLPALKKMEGGEAIAMVELMMMGAVGLNFDDLLDIPKGEMILSLIDLEQEVDPDFGIPQPKPSVVFGLTVNDMKKLDKLVDKLKEEGGLEAMEAAGFSILKNKDRFFVANTSLLPSLKAGKLPNAVAGERRKFMETNDQAVVVDFKQITRLAQDYDAPADAVQMLLKFAELRLDSNQRGQVTEMTGELRFRDAKTNGLKQIINIVEEVQEGVGIERELRAREADLAPEAVPFPPARKAAPGFGFPRRDR